MPAFDDIRAVAIDVLGTLVDEPAAIASTLRAQLPGSSGDDIDRALHEWDAYLARAQRDIVAGRRGFVDADALEAETLAHVLGDARPIDDAPAAPLSCVGAALDPWPDAVEGVRRLAELLPVYGLSNATTGTLEALASRAGFAWSGALSASAAAAYKPAPEVYRLALDATGLDAEQVLMVAAHAWDLRGAAAIGMRTAYVARPVGDPPSSDDAFDGEFGSLAELADALRG